MAPVIENVESILANSNLSREDALAMFVSMDDFLQNTERNKKLYKSIQTNTLFPTQAIRSYSEDWYESMCILHYFLSTPRKEGQSDLKSSKVFKEKNLNRKWKRNGEFFNNKATIETVIESVSNGHDIVARVCTEGEGGRAREGAEGEEDRGVVRTEEDVALDPDQEIKEWNEEKTALTMLLALSIDECLGNKDMKTLSKFLPRRGYKPKPNIIYSDADNYQTAMKRLFEYMKTEKEEQKDLFSHEEWFQSNTKSRIAKNKAHLLSLNTLLTTIDNNTDGESIATSVDWYNLVFSLVEVNELTEEMKLKIYLSVVKNEGKLDKSFILPLIFKVGYRQNLLLGDPVAETEKVIFSHQKYENVAEGIYEFVRATTRTQRRLKAAHLRKSKREVESNRRVLFLQHSIARAISSIEDGERIANDIGVNSDDYNNDDVEMDESNNDGDDFVGIASQPEDRQSFVEQREDLRNASKKSRLLLRDPIKSERQLAIVRNKNLAFQAMKSVATFLDAVPPQGGSAYYTAVLAIVRNVNETKSTGGRPKKEVTGSKPELTIISHNREQRRLCYEGLFAQGRDGAQEYDVTNIELDDKESNQTLVSKVASLKEEFEVTRKRPARKSHETTIVLERTETQPFQTPRPQKRRQQTVTIDI